jgi:transcriptional regulator with XRE-family HTH domain
MGRGRRLQPKRLKVKLKQVREQLGYTQEQMTNSLKSYVPQASIHPGHISQFESGEREPSLPMLLAYARIAGISTDLLIDDKVKLPDKLPTAHERSK